MYSAPGFRFSETLRPTMSDRLRRARSSSRKPGGKAIPQMYTECTIGLTPTRHFSGGLTGIKGDKNAHPEEPRGARRLEGWATTIVYPTLRDGPAGLLRVRLEAISAVYNSVKVILDYYLSISYRDVGANPAAVAVARAQCRFSQCKKSGKPTRNDYRTTGNTGNTGNSRRGGCCQWLRVAQTA